MEGGFDFGNNLTFTEGPDGSGIDSVNRVNTAPVFLTQNGNVYKAISDENWELITDNACICPLHGGELVSSNVWESIWTITTNETLLRHRVPDDLIANEEPSVTLEYDIPSEAQPDTERHPPHFAISEHEGEEFVFFVENGTVTLCQIIDGELRIESIEDICRNYTTCLIHGDGSLVFAVTGDGAAYMFDWSHRGFRDIGWVNVEASALAARTVNGTPIVSADDSFIYLYTEEYHGWTPIKLPENHSLASFFPIGSDGFVAGVCTSGNAIYGYPDDFTVYSHPDASFTDAYASPSGQFVLGTEDGRIGWAPNFVQWVTGAGGRSEGRIPTYYRTCPSCGFTTANRKYRYCPVDGGELERTRGSGGS